MKTWIVFDCHFLAHRAFHSTGELQDANAVETGTMFGFLRDIADMQLQFNTTNPIFCWDYDYMGSARAALLPKYKSKRKHTQENTKPDEWEKIVSFRRQVALLRTKYVPAIGYKNSFWQEGYEADDVIASIIINAPPDDEFIVVSSDKDLYQLLDGRVRIFDPHFQAKHKMMDRQLFFQVYGIEPEQWKWVKAIAGCTTDEVPGVDGVAEPTALKYLKNELPSHHKRFKDIEANTEIWKRNIPLVKLPFRGTNVFELQEDEVTVDKWQALADEVGMASLRDKAPIARRPGIRNGG